jgi:hypothetical protein
MKTPLRIDFPAVMVVGDKTGFAARSATRLQVIGLKVVVVADASTAKARMASVMPHVVVLDGAATASEIEAIQETAVAIGAEILALDPAADPMEATTRISAAADRVFERRGK